eukprot:3303631-Pyramimonas_sp.AAC.1
MQSHLRGGYPSRRQDQSRQGRDHMLRERVGPIARADRRLGVQVAGVAREAHSRVRRAAAEIFFCALDATARRRSENVTTRGSSLAPRCREGP